MHQERRFKIYEIRPIGIGDAPKNENRVRPLRYFHSLGINDHDRMLYEMGMKEKEHEVYFLGQIKSSAQSLAKLQRDDV